MTSFGLADADVIRLAQSIDVVRSHVQFTDRAELADYRLLSTVHPWVALQGNPAEQVVYSDRNDAYGGFAVVVSPRSASTTGAAHWTGKPPFDSSSTAQLSSTSMDTSPRRAR
jgi:hypothetical protein